MISFKRLTLILFVLIVVVSVCSEGIILYFNTQDELTAEVEAHLRTAAESRAAHIITFLEDKKSAVNSNAQGVVFKDLFTFSENDPRYKDTLEKARIRLKDTINADPTIYEAFALDKKGIIVVSSDPTKEGLDRSNDEYFIKGKENVFLKDVYYSEVTKQYGITISAPIKDSNKNFIGIYVARISIDYLTQITNIRSGLGNSGEIFLINSEGYMLTPSKYLPDTILKQKIDTPISRACIEDLASYANGENTLVNTPKKSIGVYNDYRGVPSLGTHALLEPQANWCLIAKIDESEALGSLRAELITVTAYIAVILIIIFSIIGYYFASLITAPINRLSSKISQITKGDLEVRLDKESSEEIQNLVDSLNRILASMKLAMLRANLSTDDIGLGEAVKAKKEAENKYKLIYDSSNDALMTLEGPSWKFTSANSATLKLFDAKNEEEFKTKGPWDVSPETQPDGKKSAVVAKKMIEKALKEGSSSFEWTHKKITGELFQAHVLLSKMDIEGKEAVQATVRDLSIEKKTKQELIESEDKFRIIFDNTPEGIYLNDPKGILIDGNKAALKIVGYKKEELLGKNMFTIGIIAKEDYAKGVKLLALNAAGKPTGPDEFNIIRKDKSRIRIELNTFPIIMNGKRIVLATLREIKD